MWLMQLQMKSLNVQLSPWKIPILQLRKFHLGLQWVFVQDLHCRARSLPLLVAQQDLGGTPPV
jgi:hypothetical protein